MNADLKPILIRLIPRAWTAEQALGAVKLLEQAIAAIWCVHGEKMGHVVLGDAAAEKPPPPKPADRRKP